MKKTVFVGMSGGIDSSATVKILVDQGYQVIGLTFVGLGETGSRKCCSVDEIQSAKNVCAALEIEHKILDLKELFKAKVRNPFVQSYINGETPNPCMLCNRHIKFGALVEYALGEGADFVAMGHYCGIDNVDGEYLFRTGRDIEKDQSYFLAMIQPDVLEFLKFPLADMKKSEVRQIVAQAGIPIRSDKQESQDICFVPDNYRDYLRTEGVSANEGMMLIDEKPVARHDGVAFYSLGQRRGLGVSVGKKIFIRSIDAEKNIIVLGEKPSSREFTVSGMNIFSRKFKDGPWLIQTRYRSTRVPGFVHRISDDEWKVVLDTPQEIVSPGQYAVFYRDDHVYAGGKIKKVVLVEENGC